jgi:hypothetical protein
MTAGGLAPADSSFSYFIHEGNPEKLLISFDGGGACWDKNTCIGSVLAGTPVYESKINETPESLAALGGAADVSNPDNPFKDYTQVFIPYCSGDIHMGSKDTTYILETPGGNIPWTIHHRGFDNVLAVLTQLRSYYQNKVGEAPKKVVLAGSSAGGYGLLLALPVVKEMLPRRTRVYMLSDSASGVLPEDFYQRAFGGSALSNGVWGVEENIPDFLLSAFASGSDTLTPAVYLTLAWHYPFTRFGQYTRAWDQSQAFFLNVMKNVDFPQRWNDPEYLFFASLEWNAKARTYMHINAFAPNYRFYIAAGTDHTIMNDDRFYTENSAQGVFFRDWTDDMVNGRFIWWNTDWRNVSCDPDCTTP